MSGMIGEAALGRHQMAAVLAGGEDVLSENQTITFTRYRRLVLPLDGFIFWVKDEDLGQAAVYGVPRYNSVASNDPPRATGTPATLVVKGSFHYATYGQQNQDDAGSLNKVIFSAQSEIKDFNEVERNVLWLGTFQGIRFSFASRESFYQQAGLWHYVGDAVYPAFETQVIDDPTTFDASELIVSNSLPIWLSLQSPTPYPDLPPGIGFPLYPSFLLPDNVVPPYAAIHVVENATSAIQAYPAFGSSYGQNQLTMDRVEVTLYGATNRMALDFIDYVQRYCLYTEVMGISNMPVATDDKRTQVELGVIAMKKTIIFDVNYHQGTSRDLARQFILSCIPTVKFSDLPAA